MSNQRRGKSPTLNESRIADAAMKLMRSYVEAGSIGKRGAIQSEAWHRLRESLNLPTNLPDVEKEEERREKERKARAIARRKEHPYSRSQIEQWFSAGFRRGVGISDDDK